MNLVDLFKTLSTPQDTNRKILSAVPIPEYPTFRIAINSDGNPVLLISALDATNNTNTKNRRLKYLQLEQNVECRINEGSKVFYQVFTLITFTSSEPDLCNYFFNIAETFIKSMKNKSTQEEILETLNRFIEIFRVLSEPPTNTVQGLWSELFLVENSADPQKMLQYWHNLPEDKYDFDAGKEKIEAKSTSGTERIHEFSSEQLTPPRDTQVLVASLFTRHSNSGSTIQELMQSIKLKIKNNNELIEKLNTVVSRTLGNSLEQSLKIRFDYQFSKLSLRFYKHQDVSKVEAVYIPAEVSSVRYKSDLSLIRPVDLSNLEKKGELFSAVI